MGLLFLTRAIDIIAVFIPLFWRIYDWRSVKERFTFWLRQYRHLLLATLIFLSIASIFFIYTRWISGHWFADTYSGETFNFLHPKFMLGLFSYQKGWFIYTPVALLGIIGLIRLWKKYPYLTPSIAVFLLLVIYITFSWKQWHYSWGFSTRPLIDILPVIGLPLCALTGYFFTPKRQLQQSFYSILLLVLITLNIFQSYQAAKGTLHLNNMTQEYYWRIFAKVHPEKGDETLLMTDDEIRKTEE